MNNIKAIFLDFDWTLFDHKTRSFNLKGVEALNEAHKKGVSLIVNSARTYYALKELKTFDLIPFDGFVVNNGGAAILNGNVLYAHYMDDMAKEEIIRILNEHNLSYNLITLYRTYIKATNPQLIKEFYDCYYEPYPLDIRQYQGESVLAIQVLSYEDSSLYS